MKRIIIAVLALTLLFTSIMFVFANGSDASARHTPADWATEDIEKALELGILDKDETYYYGSFITREEFCEMIDGLLFADGNCDAYRKADKNAKNPFTDTENQSVIKLNSLGIIKGKGSNLFAPDDYLTREEAAVIFERVFALYPDVGFDQLCYEYDDAEDISTWANNAVQIMSNAGIMQGYGNSVFYPKSILSTEEAIAMVMRFYRYIHPEVNTFADSLNLHMPDDKNYMFSPLSIKMALGLAANGAEGDTKQDILDAMQITNLDSFNENAKEMIEKYSQSDKLTLNIANSVWVNTDKSPHDFKDSYKEAVTNYYNTKASSVNDKNAVDTINDWVNDKTKGKIPTIISDSDFWAALVNAIYFKGSWEKDFSKKATKPDTFINADGTKSEIDFMNKTDSFSYGKSDDAQIIKMRYKSSFYTEDENGNLQRETIDNMNVSMYLIMTDRKDIESTLKETNLEWTRVMLSVPKFEIEYSEDITKKLDLDIAANQKLADFTGMMNLSHDEDLWIDKVLHKTYIKVDEEGTEAAAVTAVMMIGATGAKPEEPIEVKFDEPFYFVIRDDTNGEILFMGRYAFAE